MCEYKSYQEEYPGDEFPSTTTVQSKKRQGKKRKASVQNPYEGGVTYQQYVEQIGETTLGVPKRFCNDAVGSFKSSAWFVVSPTLSVLLVKRVVLTRNVGYATKLCIGPILLIRVSNGVAGGRSRIWLVVHWIS
jgi:hypothetical protein